MESENAGQKIPVIENIHQAVLSASTQAPESLDMGTWHGEGEFCGTTHCRAGWVTHLAGEAGKALEEFYNGDVLMAAMQIYHASSPIRVLPPRFFEDNERALADMKRCAAEEAKTR